MEDLAKLKTAMGLIATGLYEKERQKQEGEYFYSKRLMHGINMFHSLRYKYYPEGFGFSEIHEQKFIEKYAMRPVAEWFEGWEATEPLQLEKQKFFLMDALVEDSGFETFHISEECEDYVQYFEKDMIGGMEQREVYDCLISLNQDEYVDLRKYFIEHPITSMEEVRKLKLIYAENGIALQAIENAYEPVRKDCYVCPRCGWTLQKEKVGMRCQSRACTKEEKYIPGELREISGDSGILRLRRGLMKYMAVPGKLELEIQNYCTKHKVHSVLWPHMDTYDIEISFSGGDIWAIDAKAVREPYFLREKIRQEGGFPKGNYQKGIYVIPDEFADEKKDYLDIINKELERMRVADIYCMRLRDLKKEIRKKGVKADAGNQKKV